MIRWLRDFLQYRQDQRVKYLESRLQEKDRMISVLKTEIDSMAAVIARDRARVLAETARYARRQAEAEGITNDDRLTEQSVR